ncbi:hypothetical protein N431DRAFT_455677 [Stipitochalara longipes BDJ]|nr:hypothetical protein N431DRAFT_455677 [Stipitochalara longipes BDJ]
MSSYPSSTCATHGSFQSILNYESSATNLQILKCDQENQHQRSPISAFERHELSASHITDYLKDLTIPGVQLQHISSHESLRILTKKKTYIKALEDILNNKSGKYLESTHTCRQYAAMAYRAYMSPLAE